MYMDEFWNKNVHTCVGKKIVKFSYIDGLWLHVSEGFVLWDKPPSTYLPTYLPSWDMLKMACPLDNKMLVSVSFGCSERFRNDFCIQAQHYPSVRASVRSCVRPSIFVRQSSSVCKIKEALIHTLFCRPRSDVSPYREVAMTNSFVGDLVSPLQVLLD